MKINLKSYIEPKSIEEVWEGLLEDEGNKIQYQDNIYSIGYVLVGINMTRDVLLAQPKVCKKYYTEDGHCDEFVIEEDISLEGLKRLEVLANKQFWGIK